MPLFTNETQRQEKCVHIWQIEKLDKNTMGTLQVSISVGILSFIGGVFSFALPIVIWSPVVSIETLALENFKLLGALFAGTNLVENLCLN